MGKNHLQIICARVTNQEELTMKPMLNPAEDLKGATPENLARALLRPGRGEKPVIGRKGTTRRLDKRKGKK